MKLVALLLLAISAAGAAAGVPFLEEDEEVDPVRWTTLPAPEHGDDLLLYEDSPQFLNYRDPDQLLTLFFREHADLRFGRPANRIREAFACNHCGRPLGSKSLAVLECGHGVHESCFLSDRDDYIYYACPRCFHVGHHDDRDKDTDLRDWLEAFEDARYIAMPKLYPESRVPVDLSDPGLLFVPTVHYLPSGDEYDRPAVDRIVQAFHNKDFHAIIDIFTCPACFKPLTSTSLSILDCGHFVHEECYQDLEDWHAEGQPGHGKSCVFPECGGGLHRLRRIEHAVRQTLRFFESKEWKPPPDERDRRAAASIDRLADDDESWLTGFSPVLEQRRRVLPLKLPYYEEVPEEVPDECVLCRRRRTSVEFPCGHAACEQCVFDDRGRRRRLERGCPLCGRDINRVTLSLGAGLVDGDGVVPWPLYQPRTGEELYAFVSSDESMLESPERPESPLDPYRRGEQSPVLMFSESPEIPAREDDDLRRRYPRERLGALISALEGRRSRRYHSDDSDGEDDGRYRSDDSDTEIRRGGISFPGWGEDHVVEMWDRGSREDAGAGPSNRRSREEAIVTWDEGNPVVVLWDDFSPVNHNQYARRE